MFEKGVYKHYKGNYYLLIDLANHSETLEKMVVYKDRILNKDDTKRQVRRIKRKMWGVVAASRAFSFSSIRNCFLIP